MDYIADKLEYWVTQSEKQDYVVVFSEKSEAHQYKLSLTLGSVHGPWDAPRDFDLLRNDQGVCFVKTREIKKADDDWRDDACCQSGCPGCPWTEAQGL